MDSRVQWQAGNATPENLTALATIQTWWNRLQGQTVLWQQRLLSAETAVDQLDWNLQRFDETFALDQPALRGVTLFWHKAGETQERNLTANRLVFNPQSQALDLYSQSQANLVVRVSVPQRSLEVLQLTASEVQLHAQGEGATCVVQDVEQGLEVRILLSAAQLAQLQGRDA